MSISDVGCRISAILPFRIADCGFQHCIVAIAENWYGVRGAGWVTFDDASSFAAASDGRGW